MTDVQIATPRPYAAVVTGWVRRNARPLATFDPAAPLDDLAPLGPRVRGAAVVGVGGTTGGAHELSALTHRILRYLVEHHGIRALAIEDDWRIGRALDDHVRTGAGDPRAVLAGAWPPWRTEEVVDVVHWTRTRNEAHPDDPVRIVGLDDAALESPDEAERHMADSLVAWQERTGTRALYWGEAAHTAVGDLRTVHAPPGPPMVQRSAGSRLRDHFGPAYVSVGLTFGHGDVPWPVPSPPPELAEAALGAAGAAALIDLHAPGPAEVRAWLEAPARLRLVGPRIDPAHDGVRHMTGGSLAGWFDVIAHVERVSPSRPMSQDRGRRGRLPTPGPDTDARARATTRAAPVRHRSGR